MERILRGDLRFSCGGFTYLRIASRLYLSAPSETSAQTGRRTSLRGLFCLPAMCLPRNLVYDIPPRLSAIQIACRVNDNTLLHCNAKAYPRFPPQLSDQARNDDSSKEIRRMTHFSST